MKEAPNRNKRVSVASQPLHGYQSLCKGSVAYGNFVAAATGLQTPTTFQEPSPSATRDPDLMKSRHRLLYTYDARKDCNLKIGVAGGAINPFVHSASYLGC